MASNEQTTPTNQTKTIDDVQDATSSWSGYNHQGKVGLYLVLLTLNKLHGTTDAGNYYLEIEHLEDIAIVRNREYLSLHQVKARKDDGLASYKDAIWLLLHKAHVYKPRDGVHLHTVTKVSEFAKERFKDSIPSENIREHRNEILDEDAFDDVYAAFAIHKYHYSGKPFCPLDQIDREITEQIQQYYTQTGIPGYDVDKKRLLLLHIIHNHVLQRHKARHSEPVKVDDDTIAIEWLPFSTFIECLEEDHEQPNDFYLLCKLKEWFTQLCDDYLSQIATAGQEDVNHLIDAARLIASLTYDDFRDFTRKVNPHVFWDQLTLDKFKELFEKGATKSSLLWALRKIPKPLSQERFTYESKQKYYLPTTIDGSPTHPDYDMNRQQVALNILANTAIDSLLMEVNTLISSQMEMESLSNAAMKITEDLDESDGPSEERNHIVQMGRINMISVEKASQEVK